MNEILKAIILGVVQGITEFLPISSTAHIRIVPAFFGWEDPGAAYTAVIQIGTMLAVIIYFLKDLFKIYKSVVINLFKGKFITDLNSKLGWYIIIGTIPISIAGLLLEDLIENEFRSLYVITFSLVFFAFILALAEKYSKKKFDISNITLGKALLVGVAQAFALIPGASRSGVTITGGLIAGFNRETAARFSFLLSVPAVLLSGLYEFYKIFPILTTESSISLLVATVVSFISGILAIEFLLRFLRTHSTFIFIWYRIGLAILLLILINFNYIKP
ncbi:MAG: undecaprenyl-diphosphatase UppP [Ignavibacterium sp.]|nr:undecaprenyl-diphosphatase UppP [Ignavibacterium sp.]